MTLRPALTIAVLALLECSLPASAAVYKCDEGGRVVYMDRPCLYAPAEAKPALRVANPAAADGERRERVQPVRNLSADESAILQARPLVVR